GQCCQQQHHAQHHAGRRGQTEPLQLRGETGRVDVLHHQHGGGARSTTGKDVHLVEQLHRPDQRQHHHDHHGGHQERHGDVAERLYVVGAVDGRGVVELERDALQTSQQDKGVEAHVGPDADDDDPHHRPVGVEQELHRLHAQRDEGGVQHAVTLQDPLPDKSHHHRRQQHGIEVDAAEEPARHHLAVEDQGGHQRDDDHAADLPQHEDAGVAHGAPEPVLGTGVGLEDVVAVEQTVVVLGGDVRSVLREQLGAARGRVVHVKRHGEEDEQPEDQQVGQQEHMGHAAHAHQALQRFHHHARYVHHGRVEPDGSVGDQVTQPSPALAVLHQ